MSLLKLFAILSQNILINNKKAHIVKYELFYY